MNSFLSSIERTLLEMYRKDLVHRSTDIYRTLYPFLISRHINKHLPEAKSMPFLHIGQAYLGFLPEDLYNTTFASLHALRAFAHPSFWAPAVSMAVSPHPEHCLEDKPPSSQLAIEKQNIDCGGELN